MNIIVAANIDWGIGYKGTQPVVIREDRRHFRELTTGGIVIAGRKTLEDFPGQKPLPGRKNIILTKNRAYKVDGASIAHDVSELLTLIKGVDPGIVFVIGGGSVYNLLLPLCSRAYVTRLGIAPPSDTFLPNLAELDGWELIQKGEERISDGVPYSFDTYINNNSAINNYAVYSA